MKTISTHVLLTLLVVSCHVIPHTKARPIFSALDSCLENDGLCSELIRISSQIVERVSAATKTVWDSAQSLMLRTCSVMHYLHVAIEDYAFYLRWNGSLCYDRSLAFVEYGKVQLRDNIHAASTATKSFGKTAILLHSKLGELLTKLIHASQNS